MEQDAFLFEPREAVAWKQNRMRSRSVTATRCCAGTMRCRERRFITTCRMMGMRTM